jgi:hypothetical protein
MHTEPHVLGARFDLEALLGHSVTIATTDAAGTATVDPKLGMTQWTLHLEHTPNCVPDLRF